MIKIEKRLIEFLEKHMLLLAVLLVTMIAFLMRRQNIWYYTTDYIHFFDRHENHIQGMLYFLVVNLTGYVFDVPLHGIKWIASIADFAVAGLCVLLCKAELSKQVRITKVEKWKLFFLYTGCLVAPVLYIRGCVWAQIESLAMAFLLGALYMVETQGKRMRIVAVVLAAVGMALYPMYMLLIMGYCLYIKREEAAWLRYLFVPAVLVAIILEAVSSFVVGVAWKQGIMSFFQWMSYHPYTGAGYANVGEWLWQMLILSSYSIALISGVAAFLKKIPYVVAFGAQLLVAVCYGIVLGW